jgi:glutamyl-Q tRNA(Asp) synthetase
VTPRTRFAPSPTGPLHLGHAFSALVGAARAEALGGEFLVRLEDLDQSRARPHWEAQIHDDLAWLGLTYPRPVMRQSERGAAYAAALARLWRAGLLFRCTCSRRDIEAALSAPQEGAPLLGPDGLVYPGTCRPPPGTPPAGPLPVDGALRLNMGAAVQVTGAARFFETGRPPLGPVTTSPDALVQGVGDVVLRRRDGAAAYHLAVVVDDAEQAITEVPRGEDLFEATAIHVVLQRLLDLPTPAYHHHRLIRDASGKRLAKRDESRALATLRAAGWTPRDVRRAVGL